MPSFIRCCYSVSGPTITTGFYYGRPAQSIQPTLYNSFLSPSSCQLTDHPPLSLKAERNSIVWYKGFSTHELFPSVTNSFSLLSLWGRVIHSFIKVRSTRPGSSRVRPNSRGEPGKGCSTSPVVYAHIYTPLLQQASVEEHYTIEWEKGHYLERKGVLVAQVKIHPFFSKQFLHRSPQGLEQHPF